MSNWTVDGINLITPSGTVFVQESPAAALAILAALDEATSQRDALQAEKDTTWLTAREEAVLQRASEMLDHFRGVDALMRDKRARGERLV